MNKYLRAIGFSKIEKTDDMNGLLWGTVKNYDSKKVVETKNGIRFAEFTREFAPDCGLCVCGEYNDDDEYNIEYYFPYINGSKISSSEDVIIERRADNEAYIGACDDLRLDISLIFHLINTADYLNLHEELSEFKAAAVTLSALCAEGKILLPIIKTEKTVKERQKKLQKRNALILAAKRGDEDAIESLTVDDMDAYNEILRRVGNEDIYSIIDNCFMPYGFGSDMYSVIGDIREVLETQNSLTGEELVKLTIECNDIGLDVCINKRDLLGEPQIGRRFKGVIWLQGQVAF